jgi:hypothetical protein
MKLYRGVFILLAALALPVIALHAQDTTTIEPPPTSYAEVADEYAALEDFAVTEGTAVIDLFLNGEFAQLQDRASTDMQIYLMPDQLQQAYDYVTGIAPIGERLYYRVFVVAGERAYAAVHTWGDNQITLVVALNAANEISGLNMSPDMPLPDDPAADYRSAVTFRLPFDGLWYTFWGGPDRLHNYHVDAEPQRHAFDFVVWKDGGTCRADCAALTDYYAYGQPVLAPAAGEVVAVVDDLPESQPQVGTDADHPAGNHVVIRVADGEYLFIAHMQPGSIQLAVGDTVQTGQMIGLVGNSGNTSEPHIHIHLQSTPELFKIDDSGQIVALSDALGLPIYFSNYLANGELIEAGEPLGGQFVQNGS